MNTDAEKSRLEQSRTRQAHWKKWGPYLSERQWGTVREDYSADGDAWNYFSHDQARSRAYRWGEDGLAGVSDDHQVLCFALALWNGRDPILKERAFGLANSEGNHGEDVKEYYFYLDSTPTHSYMKYLYKYPQAAYPYDDLVRHQPQRAAGTRPSTNCSTPACSTTTATSTSSSNTPRPRRRTCWCRSPWPTAAPRRRRCTCCRRCGSATPGRRRPAARSRSSSARGAGQPVVHAHHTDPLFQESLGDYYLHVEGRGAAAVHRERDQQRAPVRRPERLALRQGRLPPLVVHGDAAAVNPARRGTKVAAHYVLEVGAGADAACCGCA